MVRLFVLSAFLLLSSCQFASKVQRPAPDKVSLPKILSDEPSVVINYEEFVISFNKKHRVPNWVMYHLKKERLNIKQADRKNDFFADPYLLAKGISSPKPTDYKYSGYDRGHMAPSADFLWSQKINDLTFSMANIAPQTPRLNRGLWRKLEGKVRKWANSENEVVVVTGPILGKNFKKLSSNKTISVPQCFYKVVLAITNRPKSIGFVICQNVNKKDILENKVFTVNFIEKLSKIDFFSGIKDEEKIESKSNFQEWFVRF